MPETEMSLTMLSFAAMTNTGKKQLKEGYS